MTQAPWRSFQCFRCGKGQENFIPAKNPCNPLISHDSDERIQGNPRKSNPKIGGFAAKRQKTQIDRMTHPPAERTQPTRSKRKAPSCMVPEWGGGGWA